MYDVHTENEALDGLLLLRQAENSTSKVVSREMLAKWGVTISAFEVLLVSSGRPVSGYRLALVLGKQHHSIIELANRMIKSGLMEREGNTLSPTTKGYSLMGEIARKLESANMIFQKLIPAESKVAGDYLRSLRDVSGGYLGNHKSGEVNIPL